MSAEDLAEKIGVSPATMYRYENGDTAKVPEDKLLPLALALNTTVNYLLGKRIGSAERGDGLTVTEMRLYEKKIRENIFYDLLGPASYIPSVDEDANVTAWSPYYGTVKVTPEIIEDVMQQTIDYFGVLLLRVERGAHK